MKPPKMEFEQVAVDVWIPGKIAEVQYDDKHEFVWKGAKKVAPAVRFIFELEGYQNKYSRWMLFNYGQKANLYKTFIEPLVEGSYPNFDFDVDELKGMNIKIMYAQNNEYQNIAMVRPLNQKLGFLTPKMSPAVEPESPPIEDEEPPF